ncbi:MAG: hypothetical protein L6R38_009389 [Xanthoria sp. 2 TBL-2021]|nr:MAG: hypothetical protein L6R38_009389 [Xanthoria sp. 2 TBL-2021]
MKSFGLLYFGSTLVTLFSCILALPQGYEFNLGSVNASQPVPQLANIADILSLSSDLLAIQLVGAQATDRDIAKLCTDFDLTRLRASGYVTYRMQHVFCQAASVTASFPSLTEVQRLTVEYSSYIWIYQAVGALNNDKVLIKQLCDSINVASAFGVGQNGTLVKTTICNYANGIELPKPDAPWFEDERFNDGGFTDTPTKAAI